MKYILKQADCVTYLKKYSKTKAKKIDLTFLDPPFNQGKTYNNYKDNLPQKEYWDWMTNVCRLINERTTEGGAIYFMQREKNAHHVIKALGKAGWTFRNLIIWKKKTSAVPMERGFGKKYQIIVFAIKSRKPRIFNKLRINPPRLPNEKYKRPNGVYVTDVWDDIRELTSGYFAGKEPLRLKGGKRLHEQQSPVALLVRIILSSSAKEDLVFDPFAGTGTTLVVAKQLKRKSIGIEIDPTYVTLIEKRLLKLRQSDDIKKLLSDYKYTKDINRIWGLKS